MIDIHSHILPGVDDGAETIEQSLEMLRIAAEGGTKLVIATPHCNIPYEESKNYLTAELRDAFYALRDRAKAEGIGASIMPGMEVLLTEEAPGLFRSHKFLTLAGSRYLLVEFFFDESEEYMSSLLAKIKAEGVVPVIAHPERYGAVQEDIGIAERWHSLGYALQVNKGSILGHLGMKAEIIADKLLTRKLSDFVASDAHGTRTRNPEMALLRNYLEDVYGAEYTELLLETNPGHILTDSPLN